MSAVRCLYTLPGARLWGARRESAHGATRGIHHAEGSGQERRTESHQTADAGSRAARTAAAESRVVDRIQSAAQSTGLPVQRTSGGGASSLYQVRRIFILLLAGYKRLISPLLPSACRYYPTCSEYMREAIEVHGAARGVWMGLKRLGRCHPFHEGGCDPVPR